MLKPINKDIFALTIHCTSESNVWSFRRVNYRIDIWKNAQIAQPDIPGPLENHGWTKKTGVLEPFRFKEGEIVSESMVDVVIDAVSNEFSQV